MRTVKRDPDLNLSSCFYVVYRVGCPKNTHLVVRRPNQTKSECRLLRTGRDFTEAFVQKVIVKRNRSFQAVIVVSILCRLFTSRNEREDTRWIWESPTKIQWSKIKMKLR
jgi:hypothetical protein